MDACCNIASLMPFFLTSCRAAKTFLNPSLLETKVVFVEIPKSGGGTVQPATELSKVKIVLKLGFSVNFQFIDSSNQSYSLV